MEQVTAKLGGMRKAVQWIVYPQREPDSIVIQTDKRIALIGVGKQAGKGILSAYCASGASFAHLNRRLGATIIDVSQEVIDAVIAACPKPGAVIGGGVVLGGAGKCYACDAPASGKRLTRDYREGGEGNVTGALPACARHAETVRA